jgi:hypothetical protein
MAIGSRFLRTVFTFYLRRLPMARERFGATRLAKSHAAIVAVVNRPAGR